MNAGAWVSFGGLAVIAVLAYRSTMRAGRRKRVADAPEHPDKGEME